MDSLIAEGRSLSSLILLPATAVFLIMLVLVLSRTAGRVTQFLICAVWLQWILSAFHSATSKLSPLGLSWNALASCAVIGAGVWVIKRRKLKDPALVPFYVMAAAIICSGAANHAWAGAIDMAIRYAYLVVLILATVDAISEVGNERFSKLALWPFAIPVSLQALSVILGAGQVAEVDGLMSYIGGYRHEVTFALGLAGGLLLVCMGQRFSAWIKAMLIAICCGAFYLANFSYAIIAMVPLVAVVVITGVTRRIVLQQRPLAAGAMVVAVAVIMLGTIAISQDGLRGPAKGSNPQTQAVKPHVAPVQKAFGFGPSASPAPAAGYAHNAISASIYELGAFGAAALLALWAWMIGLSIRVTDGSRWLLLGGHGSFLLVNMGTMPLWNNEGLILYGLLCGYTVARYQACRRVAAWRNIADQPLNWTAEVSEIV